MDPDSIPSEPPPALAADSAAVSGLAGLLLAVVVLIILSMIFSSSESAFLSINRLRIRFLRSKKDRGAIRVGRLLDRKEQLLNTVLVGNNIVNIAITALLTSLALQLFGSSGVGIATLASTVVLLIFGEITPKTVGSRHPEPVAFLFSGLISFSMKLLSPLVFVFSGFARLASRALGIKSNQKTVSFTEDEIKNFIDVGEEEGVLEQDEKRMMHRVFRFTDLAAKDIMVPRTKIVAISLTASYHSIIELAQQSRLSRFPVYRQNLDDIVGVLYIKDMMFYQGKSDNFFVQDIMRPPLYIVGTKKMSSVQQMLRENRQSLAVVIDEYSGTDGILTTEDISREIFGTVGDEFYQARMPQTVELAQGEALVDGAIRLTEVAERFGCSLHSEFYETLGGYLSEKLDKVPVEGDFYREQGMLFTVKEADATRILTIHVKQEAQ
ncbi:MAG: HlyC/CorC family transporter [Spirochaetaceae bacterium]|nr:HlyC/CorC family transporter [Spirochaetaceae bacterium]MBQ7366482.1 HlyC/CorC family transporter [Spirochaetaceae bacterium]